MADIETIVKEFGAGVQEIKTGMAAQSSDMQGFKAALGDVARRVDLIETKANRPAVIGAASGEISPERKAFRQFLKTGNVPSELKASLTQVEDGTGLLAPAEVSNEILRLVTEYSPIRSLARVQQISGSSFVLPMQTDVVTATTRRELSAMEESSVAKLGKKEIFAREMDVKVLVSRRSLEDASFDLEGYIMGEMARAFAVLEGQWFVNGDGGDTQAEGIMTSAKVPDFHNGHATTLQTDNLIDLTYQVKSPYLLDKASIAFLMTRQTLGKVKLLKDGLGAYMFQPQERDAIWGYPVAQCPDMPAVGSGNYPILWGNLRKAYLIIDRASTTVQVDPFTQADNGLVVFRGYRRVGGAIVDPNAIVKLHMAV